MPHIIRARAEAALAGGEGAFLRCDRGEALYVSDLPARTDSAPYIASLSACGFEARLAGKLLRITPPLAWREEFTAALGPSSGLMREFMPLRERDIGPGERDLWILGLKLLEVALIPKALYEKRVRQAAAVAMRTKTGGSALYDCAALIPHI